MQRDGVRRRKVGRYDYGLTPTGGVMMGTRTGDLDPGVVLFLMRREGATADSVERMIDGDAGLRALGGMNDMRVLRKRAGRETRVRGWQFVSSVAAW